MTKLRDRYRAWRIARVMLKHGYTEGLRFGVRKGWIAEAGDDYVRLTGRNRYA